MIAWPRHSSPPSLPYGPPTLAGPRAKRCYRRRHLTNREAMPPSQRHGHLRHKALFAKQMNTVFDASRVQTVQASWPFRSPPIARQSTEQGHQRPPPLGTVLHSVRTIWALPCCLHTHPTSAVLVVSWRRGSGRPGDARCEERHACGRKLAVRDLTLLRRTWCGSYGPCCRIWRKLKTWLTIA